MEAGRPGDRTPGLLVLGMSAGSRIAAVTVLAVATAAAPLGAQPTLPTPEQDALYDASDWLLVGSLFTASLVLMPLDDEVREIAVDMRGETSNGVSDILRPLGRTMELAAVSAATYAVGRVVSNERVADFGLHAFVSLALSNFVTGSLKVVSGRARPLVLGADSAWARQSPNEWDLFGGWESDGARTSYASGHTSSAFAIATVFAEELGGAAPWIAYPIAAGVAWSRVNDEAHWASDVVMGALVGIVSGHLVVRHGHRRGGWLERTFLEPAPSLDRLDITLRVPSP